jgi:hypothetical protein
VKQPAAPDISGNLIEAIRVFPVRREIEHCGARIAFDPFDFYVVCPRCGVRIKVRSFSAAPEIEDVFDAVFEWLNQEEAWEVAERRQAALAAEE